MPCRHCYWHVGVMIGRRIEIKGHQMVGEIGLGSRFRGGGTGGVGVKPAARSFTWSSIALLMSDTGLARPLGPALLLRPRMRGVPLTVGAGLSPPTLL